MRVDCVNHFDGWEYRVEVDGRGKSNRGYRTRVGAYVAAWFAARELRHRRPAPVPPRLPVVCAPGVCDICDDRRDEQWRWASEEHA